MRVQEDSISHLKSLKKSHKGNQSLNFVVYETENKLKLHLASRKSKVKISTELLQALQKQDVKYKLN